jgi:aminoglycoside phosphotransferase (APT) family kinase protein
MMEDMAPARQGDQVAGCSLAVAECAMDEIARLHAPRWGDPALLVHPLFAPRRSAGLQFEFYESLWQAFLGRYQDRLEPEVLAVGLALHDRYTTYARAYPGPSTLIHADFRLDNVLIGEESRRPTMAVVDWQTFTVGCSAHDVAYFLGAGLLRDDRRRHERELVRRYHEALRAGGVRDYSWDQLWHDYRWYSYSGYVMAVVASTIVVQTERGDEMFMTMAKRHAQQVLDLDAQAVLDAVT